MNIEGISLYFIITLYKEGKDINYIANYYQISNVKKLVNKIHEFILDKSLFEIYSERIKNIKPEELYNLREKGMTNIEIANLYDISKNNVKNIISKYCKDNNLKKPYYISKKKQLDEDEIEKDLLNGLTYKEMCAKYGVATATLKRRLLLRYTEDEIFEIKHRKFFGAFNDTNILIKIYEAGIKTRDISKYCNISPYIVEDVLNKYYKVESGHLPKFISEAIFNESIKTNEPLKLLQYNSRQANRIIPTYLIYKYNGFILDENNIRKYIEEKVLTNKKDERFAKRVLEDIDFSKLLKDKNYDIKNQITALLYHLPNTDYSNISELIDIIGRRY